MKKIFSISLLVALVIALVAAYFTNPTELQHKREAEEALAEYLDQYISKDTGVVGGLYDLMGDKIRTFIASTLSEGLNERITRDDYVFFSLTRFHYEGKSHIVGIGAFGEVHVFETAFTAVEENLRKSF